MPTNLMSSTYKSISLYTVLASLNSGQGMMSIGIAVSVEFRPDGQL
jgi:hypothetical protein